MTTLRSIRIVAWAAVAILAATVLWLTVGNRNGGDSLGVASIGGPFSLVDQNGNAVTEAALKGHPSAMFFGYTFCPDVCPATLADMTIWLGDLGEAGDRLKVYFVTVDPERDTPDKIRGSSASLATVRPSTRCSPPSASIRGRPPTIPTTT
jgi:protein SCO1